MRAENWQTRETRGRESDKKSRCYANDLCAFPALNHVCLQRAATFQKK